MLQRAASSACSWWWSAHIRTKHTKWLEQCLIDQEEKVQSMLKIIAEDGDSFAKRAEMYYKRRPELIESVEESYKAFKALADRYDILSKELQNANQTIGTVFPEQIQLSMEEEDDFNNQTFPRKPTNQLADNDKVPKAPTAPVVKLKGLLNAPKKERRGRRTRGQAGRKKVAPKSGLSKQEGLAKIDRIHKEILAQQTVKEFVKTSYENGLAKYREIENQIMEMQEKVIKLQDEFNADVVIDDDEARSLMTGAALESCERMLSSLQEKQYSSSIDAREESEKLEAARELLNSIKRGCLIDQTGDEKLNEEHKPAMAKDASKYWDKNASNSEVQESKESDRLHDISDKGLDFSSMGASWTEMELADKVDELVNKVVSLETAMLSQTAFIDSLRSETQNLHDEINNLESQKEALMADAYDLRSLVIEMEEKMSRIEDPNKNLESNNSNLQINEESIEQKDVHNAGGDKSFSHAMTIGAIKEVKEENEEIPEQELNEESPEQKDVHSAGIGGKSFSRSTTIEEIKDVKEVNEESPEEELNEESIEQKDVHNAGVGGKSFSRAMTIGEIKDVKEVNEESIGQKGVQNADVGVKSFSRATTILETKDVKEVGVDVQDVPKPSESDPKKKFREPFKKSIAMSRKSTEHVHDYDGNEAIKPETPECAEKDVSWQEAILSGTEEREKVLLQEYTSILMNYKDVKKRLRDRENKEKDTQFDATVQIKELREVIVKKDQEIYALTQKLNLVHENKDVKSESEGDEVKEALIVPNEGSKDETKFTYESPDTSVLEEKFQVEIDAMQEDNMDIWIRFSTAVQQVQKFKSEIQDLQDEISKLNEKRSLEPVVTPQLKAEARSHYKHLRSIYTELAVWSDQSRALKQELKGRFSSLCSIQDDIMKVLNEGDDHEITFSSHQAAKLQGEILNMKQENGRVTKELQVGLDHGDLLNIEIEKALKDLNDEFGIATDKPPLQHSLSKSRVPLRNFIFGTKPKKNKQSIFSFINTNKKYPAHRPALGYY